MLNISEIQILPIKPQSGLVGFASAVIDNQFYIGNIAIHSAPQTQLGYRLVFPNKKLASGQVVDCFHPINREAEQLVSNVIVKKYVALMHHFHNIESKKF